MSLLRLSSMEYLIPFWTNYPLKIMPSCMFITGTKLSIITFPIAFFPMKIIPFATSFGMNGVGNGNPLHYSCLENPTDIGAGQTTVHRVAKSWTRLSSWAVDARVTEVIHIWKPHLSKPAKLFFTIFFTKSGFLINNLHVSFNASQIPRSWSFYTHLYLLYFCNIESQSLVLQSGVKPSLWTLKILFNTPPQLFYHFI